MFAPRLLPILAAAVLLSFSAVFLLAGDLAAAGEVATCAGFSSFEEATAYLAAHPDAERSLDPDRDGRACDARFGPASAGNATGVGAAPDVRGLQADGDRRYLLDLAAQGATLHGSFQRFLGVTDGYDDSLAWRKRFGAELLLWRTLREAALAATAPPQHAAIHEQNLEVLGLLDLAATQMAAGLAEGDPALVEQGGASFNRAVLLKQGLDRTVEDTLAALGHLPAGTASEPGTPASASGTQ